MKPQYTQVKRATYYEKLKMAELARQETVCSEELFWPFDDDDVPYIYKVEKHGAYQLQAYRIDNGEMADCSYHLLVARCGTCGELVTIDGSDSNFCSECDTWFE